MLSSVLSSHRAIAANIQIKLTNPQQTNAIGFTADVGPKSRQ